MIYIYNIVFIILLPLLFLRLFLKSIKLKAYRYRWNERLGIFIAPKNLDNNIWVHAVSVGEIMAAMPVIQHIQAKLPSSSIIITCTTPAASYIIQKKLANLFHVYFPFDIKFAINNFLHRVKPKLVIILEKEIWPNLILACHKNNIPVIIANAQITNRSFSRYLLIKPWISLLLKNISCICAQTKFDAYKFKKLINNNINNVMVFGNTKFDLIAPNEQIETKLLSRPVWIAASTHPGEEELVLQAHQEIINQIPDALLILVPRHSERCPDIIKKIKDFKVVVRGQQPGSPEPSGQVYLVDSVGELNLLYSMSQVAFVGGSFVHVGGHNILEPAALGVPVIVGPYNANNKNNVIGMKRADGLFLVKDPKELAVVIIKLLLNQSFRERVGLNAKNFLLQRIGVSEKIAALVMKTFKNIQD